MPRKKKEEEGEEEEEEEEEEEGLMGLEGGDKARPAGRGPRGEREEL